MIIIVERSPNGTIVIARGVETKLILTEDDCMKLSDALRRVAVNDPWKVTFQTERRDI